MSDDTLDIVIFVLSALGAAAFFTSAVMGNPLAAVAGVLSLANCALRLRIMADRD